MIYAKEGKFDTIFIKEGIPTQLGMLMKACFVDNSELVMGLLTQTVSGKEIRNDDKVLDLLNYAIGSLKCFTQTNKQVQEGTIQARLIPVLAACMDKILSMPMVTP